MRAWSDHPVEKTAGVDGDAVPVLAIALTGDRQRSCGVLTQSQHRDMVRKLGELSCGHPAPPLLCCRLLLRRYWRQGLASEGARELIRHGFEDLRLPRIFAETMAVNTASRATMTALGMEHVRTFHMEWAEPLTGSVLGEVEYAITRERWLACQAAKA
ncbi:GNAT family protein [Nonomuraea sp. B19D2]|uniref:GNAT family N-acetyltransferase n=1 Tax=Nonomuraea sp. B19D2 TaxID=3159561 RepID=UPI0032DBC01E